MSSARFNVRCGATLSKTPCQLPDSPYALSACLLVFWLLLGLFTPGYSEPAIILGELPVSVKFDPEPVQLSPIYLRHKVAAWFQGQLEPDPAELEAWISELYLQSGYPDVRVYAESVFGTWTIQIIERPPQLTKVRRIEISGGSPRERFQTRHNLRQREGEPLDRKQLFTDVTWLENNHFLPLQLIFHPAPDDQVDLELHVVTGADYIPTGNLALNGVVGLAVTAGMIVDNPFESGQIVRAMGKRNNIPFPFGDALGLVQDWEYILGWATNVTPFEGTSLGINQYNKVDYIYPNFSGNGKELVWIRSLGADIYSGFPIWSDPEHRRYVRGVFNLTLIDDEFHVDPLPATSDFAQGPQPNPSATPATPQGLSKSGKTSDLMLMPSLTVSYSDIDDYRMPKFGNFMQARLAGSVLDARFFQATLTGTSFWTPYSDDEQQWTFVLRSAAGTTFGANPPFHRGFLNTGSWLVRGATQFSITEKHSLRFSEEMHYIYKPTPIQIDQFLQALIGMRSNGIFDGWALDANVFLDQGAYWRDSIAPRSGQLTIGGGINAITPYGSIIGVDVATPIYPSPGSFTALLRISAPLSFTLYSDWGNTNGFFLR